eukprot:jgi/Mesvir1/21201/Mv21548-RA.1
MPIYTRHGDLGKTRLFTGDVVDKFDSYVEAVGDVDELNSAIGLARVFCRNQRIKQEILPFLQKRLLDVGSALSTPSDGQPHRNRFDPEGQCVRTLESWIDMMDEDLSPLRNFVLPGGDGEANSCLHLARSVCRRAERSVAFLASTHEGRVDVHVLSFMNRMSDLLFVCARMEADASEKAVAYRQMHEMASTRAMFFYNLLGIPTIVLSATAGTLAFSGRKFPNVNMDMCVGAASMLVSALSGIQNFLHFSQKSEQHKQMVHKFAAFYHTVDAELTKHRKHRMNPFDFLQVLRLDLDRLVSDGPTIPPSIRKKHEKTLEVRRCRRNSDETEIIISVNKEEERMAVV